MVVGADSCTRESASGERVRMVDAGVVALAAVLGSERFPAASSARTV